MCNNSIAQNFYSQYNFILLGGDGKNGHPNTGYKRVPAENEISVLTQPDISSYLKSIKWTYKNADSLFAILQVHQIILEFDDLPTDENNKFYTIEPHLKKLKVVGYKWIHSSPHGLRIVFEVNPKTLDLIKELYGIHGIKSQKIPIQGGGTVELFLHGASCIFPPSKFTDSDTGEIKAYQHVNGEPDRCPQLLGKGTFLSWLAEYTEIERITLNKRQRQQNSRKGKRKDYSETVADNSHTAILENFNKTEKDFTAEGWLDSLICPACSHKNKSLSYTRNQAKKGASGVIKCHNPKCQYHKALSASKFCIEQGWLTKEQYNLDYGKITAQLLQYIYAKFNKKTAEFIIRLLLKNRFIYGTVFLSGEVHKLSRLTGISSVTIKKMLKTELAVLFKQAKATYNNQYAYTFPTLQALYNYLEIKPQGYDVRGIYDAKTINNSDNLRGFTMCLAIHLAHEKQVKNNDLTTMSGASDPTMRKLRKNEIKRGYIRMEETFHFKQIDKNHLQNIPTRSQARQSAKSGNKTSRFWTLVYQDTDGKFKTVENKQFYCREFADFLIAKHGNCYIKQQGANKYTSLLTTPA